MKIIDEYTKITALRRTAAFLLFTVAVLSGMLVKMHLSEKQAQQSKHLLAESEYRSSLDGLADALDSGEPYLLYHFVRSASEKAAMAGEAESSVFFGNSAARIVSGEDMGGIREDLRSYLENGRVQEPVSSEEKSHEAEIGAVTAYRTEEADKCIARLFGEHNSLKRERMTGNGRIVYSCTNAYASLDARTGLPIEVTLSLPAGACVLEEEECARLALRFVSEFYPRDPLAPPVILFSTADGIAGTFEFEILSCGRTISALVRRDSGRITRILVR